MYKSHSFAFLEDLMRFFVVFNYIFPFHSFNSSLFFFNIYVIFNAFCLIPPLSITGLNEFVTKADCTKKWPLTALDIAFRVIIWGKVFSESTTPSASSKPLPFMSPPMLSKKLIKSWNPPRIHTMPMDFALIISVSFTHNDCLNVTTGVTISRTESVIQ